MLAIIQMQSLLVQPNTVLTRHIYYIIIPITVLDIYVMHVYSTQCTQMYGACKANI